MQNKLKKIDSIRSRSVEYAQFGMFQILSRIMYVSCLLILGLSFWFVYTRMYNTIGQIESITTISPLAHVQIINIEAYNAVQTILEKRTLQQVPPLIRDPFQFSEGILITEPVSTSTIDTDEQDPTDSFTQNL